MPMSKRKIDWDKYPEKLWPFIAHGSRFTGHSSKEYYGTSPFSSKDGKFYVNSETGQWSEKMLDLSGNTVTFLTVMTDAYESNLPQSKLRELAKRRKLPLAAMKGYNIGWSGSAYMLPIRSVSGSVVDIRRYNPKVRRLMTTKGITTHLFNAQKLKNLKKGTRVWFVEGEWDCIAMSYLLKKLGRKDVVVGTPGAGIFKKEWMKLLKNYEVVFCYDNDATGDKGAIRARDVMAEAGLLSQCQWLNWPEDYPDGWDLNDFIGYAIEHAVGLEKAYKRLELMVERRHRRDDKPKTSQKGAKVTDHDDDEEEVTIEWLTDAEAPTFEQLLKVYRKYLQMDSEMVAALKFCLGVAYSQQIVSKDPVWGFLVAPPGGGKTVLLSSMKASPLTYFMSAVRSTSLVSGFKAAGNADPSVLPRLNGRVAIFKDWTVMMAKDYGYADTMAMFRDAYDGQYQQEFGNGVQRHYTDLHFTVLAGVTPQIKVLRDSVMGERFLKYYMKTGTVQDIRDRMVTSMVQLGHDKQMEDEMCDITERFLRREMPTDVTDKVMRNKDYAKRIASLALLISKLRASVVRAMRDEDRLEYRPDTELGTRPFKQLMKFAASLTFLLRKTEMDEEVFDMVRRVAMDSCIDFNFEFIELMMKRGNQGVTTKEMMDECNASSSTINRALGDMSAINVVYKVKPEEDDPVDRLRSRGRPAARWHVQPDMVQMWLDAGLPCPQVVHGAPRAGNNGTEPGTGQGKHRRRVRVRARRRGEG